MMDPIVEFGKRATQAATRIRRNLCAPVVARSNERTLSRILAVQKEDLDNCRADLDSGKLWLYYMYFTVAVFLCLLLILALSWAKSRRKRQELELQIQHRDLVIKDLRDEVTRLRNGSSSSRQRPHQEAARPISPMCTSHVLQNYAGEIDNCLQQ